MCFCFFVFVLYNNAQLHLADKSFENNNNYYNNYRVSCDRLEDSVQRKVCEVEHSYAFYSPEKHPLVFVKDVSFQRYYATRDVQGWSLAFRNISFEVLELSYRCARHTYIRTCVYYYDRVLARPV